MKSVFEMTAAQEMLEEHRRMHEAVQAAYKAELAREFELKCFGPKEEWELQFSAYEAKLNEENATIRTWEREYFESTV